MCCSGASVPCEHVHTAATLLPCVWRRQCSFFYLRDPRLMHVLFQPDKGVLEQVSDFKQQHSCSMFGGGSAHPEAGLKGAHMRVTSFVLVLPLLCYLVGFTLVAHYRCVRPPCVPVHTCVHAVCVLVSC